MIGLVNLHMSRKFVGATEALFASRMGTCMRFLASVGSNVAGTMLEAGKGLAARLVRAFVRPWERRFLAGWRITGYSVLGLDVDVHTLEFGGERGTAIRGPRDFSTFGGCLLSACNTSVLIVLRGLLQ